MCVRGYFEHRTRSHFGGDEPPGSTPKLPATGHIDAEPYGKLTRSAERELRVEATMLAAFMGDGG